MMIRIHGLFSLSWRWILSYLNWLNWLEGIMKDANSSALNSTLSCCALSIGLVLAWLLYKAVSHSSFSFQVASFKKWRGIICFMEEIFQSRELVSFAASNDLSS